MGAFQDWDPGLQALRELRPDLADWATFAMAEAKKSVAENNLLELPQTIVQATSPPGTCTLGSAHACPR